MDGLAGHQVAHMLGRCGDVQNRSENDFMPEGVTLHLELVPCPFRMFAVEIGVRALEANRKERSRE